MVPDKKGLFQQERMFQNKKGLFKKKEKIVPKKDCSQQQRSVQKKDCSKQEACFKTKRQGFLNKDCSNIRLFPTQE